MIRTSLLALVGLSLCGLFAFQIDASQEPQLVTVPLQADAGHDKHVTVLVDDEVLKLATISLSGGTALPAHVAPVPTTIHVLAGEGVIRAGGESMQVSQGSIVILEAKEEHEVVPAAEGDMLLLVHYLRGGGSPDPADAEHKH